MSAISPSAYRPPPIAARVRAAARERGPAAVLAACTGWALRYAACRARGSRGRVRTFTFGGRRYRYFAHPYHYTWLNERAVEVPIAMHALEEARGRRVMEIGNVTSHYFAAEHPIIDKYERASGVRNADVLDLAPDGTWDLIVSISTLEHIGLDEFPQDPHGPIAAISHLRSALAPGGRLLATIPVGQNPSLDAAIRSGEAGFDSVRALRRITAANRWQQVDVEAVRGGDYDFLLHTAHALLICELFGGAGNDAPPAGA